MMMSSRTSSNQPQVHQTRGSSWNKGLVHLCLFIQSPNQRLLLTSRSALNAILFFFPFPTTVSGHPRKWTSPLSQRRSEKRWSDKYAAIDQSPSFHILRTASRAPRRGDLSWWAPLFCRTKTGKRPQIACDAACCRHFDASPSVPLY